MVYPFSGTLAIGYGQLALLALGVLLLVAVTFYAEDFNSNGVPVMSDDHKYSYHVPTNSSDFKTVIGEFSLDVCNCDVGETAQKLVHLTRMVQVKL